MGPSRFELPRLILCVCLLMLTIFPAASPRALSSLEKDEDFFTVASDRFLYAVDRKGLLLWKYEASNEIAGLSTGDVNGDGEPETALTTQESFLILLDSSGEELWKVRNGLGRTFDDVYLIESSGQSDLKEIWVKDSGGLQIFDYAGRLKRLIGLRYTNDTFFEVNSPLDESEYERRDLSFIGDPHAVDLYGNGRKEVLFVVYRSFESSHADYVPWGFWRWDYSIVTPSHNSVWKKIGWDVEGVSRTRILAVGDVNQDGGTDLLVTYPGGGIEDRVYLGEIDLLLLDGKTRDALLKLYLGRIHSGPQFALVGDLDEDGRPDFVYDEQRLLVAASSSTGEELWTHSMTKPKALLGTDVNGDGKMDTILGEEDAVLTISSSGSVLGSLALEGTLTHMELSFPTLMVSSESDDKFLVYLINVTSSEIVGGLIFDEEGEASPLLPGSQWPTYTLIVLLTLTVLVLAFLAFRHRMDGKQSLQKKAPHVSALEATETHVSLLLQTKCTR